MHEAIKTAIENRTKLERDLLIKAMDDDAYRQGLLDDPRKAIAALLGKELPAEINVKVVEEEPATLTIVLPRKPQTPESGAELSDDALDAVAGGGNIGVAASIATTLIAAITTVA